LFVSRARYIRAPSLPSARVDQGALGKHSENNRRASFMKLTVRGEKQKLGWKKALAAQNLPPPSRKSWRTT